MSSTTLISPAETRLWHGILRHDVRAFEQFVHRFQTLVCSVAYSVCGDRLLSEDAAQETFWAVWKEPQALRDETKLLSWLCGIARNLARNKVRAQQKGRVSTNLENIAEPASPSTAEDRLVTQEEENLVWQALEEIPENYREPLVLFYRQEHSVEAIATAMEISPDAAKQRLSRGREMLREQVATLVESALLRNRPGKSFTIAVMAGLTSLTVGAKSALAASAGTALGAGAKVAATSALPGLAGALLGAAGGLAGGYIGAMAPAQFASTLEQKELLTRRGKQLFYWSILFTVGVLLFTLLPLLREPWAYWTCGIGIVLLSIGFSLVIAVHAMRTGKLQRQLMQDDANHTENPSYVFQKAKHLASRYEGRSYTSKWRFLGLPLVSIQVRDPILTSMDHQRIPMKHAKGWIAIGDRATGLIALGGVAKGGIAIGGMAIGGVAIGGCSLGLISLGGVAAGGLALGGLAIGYLAGGGGAIAWQFGVGGGALAYEHAFGGAAIANSYAIGGVALAEHANDAAAHAAIDHHWLKQGMEVVFRNNTIFVISVLLFILPLCLLQTLLYRNKQ